MPVDTIHRHIGSAILEPFDRDIAGIETGVLHFRERLDPINPFAMILPKLIRLRSGEVVHILVLRRIDVRALRPSLRHRMNQGVRTPRRIHLSLPSSDSATICRQVSSRTQRAFSLTQTFEMPKTGTSNSRRDAIPTCSDRPAPTCSSGFRAPGTAHSSFPSVLSDGFDRPRPSLAGLSPATGAAQARNPACYICFGKCDRLFIHLLRARIGWLEHALSAFSRIFWDFSHVLRHGVLCLIERGLRHFAHLFGLLVDFSLIALSYSVAVT